VHGFEALSYRDDEAGLRAYRDELLNERQGEVRGRAFRSAARVFACRAARIAGGYVAIAGALAMTMTAFVTRALPWALGFKQGDTPLTPFLVFSVIGALMVALVVSIAAKALAPRVALRNIATSSDVRADVTRLERPSTSAFAALAHRMELRSVSAPLVGAALVTPLTLHLLFAWVVGSHTEDLIKDFDAWIFASLVLTIPAHAVLAFLAVRFAKKLRAWRVGEALPSVWAPLGWTTLAGCVPGIVLFLIPPILVGVTGLFVPITFRAMRDRALHERALLEAA
jgi:hypothetical protein